MGIQKGKEGGRNEEGWEGAGGWRFTLSLTLEFIKSIFLLNQAPSRFLQEFPLGTLFLWTIGFAIDFLYEQINT